MNVILTVIATCLAFSSGFVWAFDTGTIESGEVIERPMDEETDVIEDNRLLRGVVIGRTMTPLGDEFRHHLGLIWREMNINALRILSVQERPSAHYGSQVIVRYDGEIIFQAILPPNRESTLERYARVAAERAARSARTQLGNINDPDLAEDEL